MSLPTTASAVAAAIPAVVAEHYPGLFVQTRVVPGLDGDYVNVAWDGGPLAVTVEALLADLSGHGTVIRLDRHNIWACGRFHGDAETAEAQHRAYERDADEDGLDEDDADDDFVLHCVPLPDVAQCPWCGGDGRQIDRRTWEFEPCPVCETRGRFDLADPDQATAYAAFWSRLADKARRQQRREQKAVTAAATDPATWAPETDWKPLPSRAAGYLNGLPVAPADNCDYLCHADDKAKRQVCRHEPRWFSATTGLRVCTLHKNAAPTDPRDANNVMVQTTG